MKWFKHQADLSRDEGIRQYLDESSDRLAAYGFFMLVLEILAERMVFQFGDPKCWVSFSKRQWALLTNCHVNRVVKYLPSLGVIGWVSVEFDGQNYRVEIQRMLEWRDEYSRKKGLAPESIRTSSHKSKNRLRKEEEQEQEIHTHPPTHTSSHTAPDFEKAKRLNETIENVVNQMDINQD
jgi:hypothetical protein